MKTIKLISLLSWLFFLPAMTTAQEDFQTDPEIPGGGWLNASINQQINNAFRISFQTKPGVTTPINLQVTPVDGHINSTTIISYTKVIDRFILILEVEVLVYNHNLNPTGLSYAFHTYKYRLQIDSSSKFNYTFFEI